MRLWSAPRLRAVLVSLALVVLSVAAPARAQSEDAAVGAAIDAAMSDASLDPHEARKRVREALDRCDGGKCTNATRGRANVALGIKSFQLGRPSEALDAFDDALKADPDAQLPPNAPPEVGPLWASARRDAARPSAPPAAPAPPPAPPPPPAPRPAPVITWVNPQAFALAREALAADLAGKLDECVAKEKAVLRLEEQATSRLHLSSCERRSGLYLDALTDLQKAMEYAIRTRDMAVVKVAEPRLRELIQKIPRITFDVPQDAAEVSIVVDGRQISGDPKKRFSIDPGKHRVHAGAVIKGVPSTADAEVDARDGEVVVVKLMFRRVGYLTEGQRRCIEAAQNEDELRTCYEASGRPLVVRAALESGGYADTNHVYVFTPAIHGEVTSPTGGWNAGGSFLVDAVTAASPEIVSQASPRYKEQRYAGTVHGGYKPGAVGVSAGGQLSSEPDYLSMGGNVAVTMDLLEKQLSPRVEYGYSHDVIGRAGTPFSEFSHQLDIHTIGVSSTMVLTPTTVLVAGATLELDRGDPSKPYRKVPMFSPDVVERIPAAAADDLVNHFRLPLMPYEQLPTERDRWALGARLAQRIGQTTLRLEERLYYDTWDMKATTSDARWLVDAGSRLRIWPHARVHLQSATSFYRLAYAVPIAPDGSFAVPLYRTDDRDLGALYSLTGGAGARLAIGSPQSAAQYGLTLQGDVMYTGFSQALYISSRTALFGTLGFEVETQ